MEKIEAIEKLIYLVKQIPDDRIEKIIEKFEDFCDEKGIVIIEPFARSKARPEFVKELEEADDEIRRGEVVSHEEVQREIFGE